MLKKASAVALCLTFSGCSSYYVVSTQLVPNQKASAASEIVESSAASSVKGKINKIAIKAPDTCVSQSAGSASGATGVSTVVATRCGVEMAALERSLARAGYEVISWKLMDEGLARGATTLAKLAESLGADGLIQVNSLEKSKSKIPSDSLFDTKYYESDSKSVRSAYTNLTPKISQFVDSQFLSPLQKVISNKTLLSVSLDATLLYVPTQQAVWFYKNTVLQSLPPAMSKEYAQLFKCGDPCEPIMPELVQQQINTLSRSDMIAANDPDSDDAKYGSLIRQIVDDFTNKATKVIRN